MPGVQQSKEPHFYEREPEVVLILIEFGPALILTPAGLVMLMIELHGY